MIKINKNYIVASFAMLALTSCSDYLDKTPSVSSNTPVTTSGNLLAVYDAVTNRRSTNYFAMYGTDDTQITAEMYSAKPATFNINYVVSNYLHYRDGIIANSNDQFWTGEYSKIYSANLIINSAASVTGDAQEIKEAVSSAYFMRAYEFFNLVTYYCLPWSEENKSSLGVPIRLNLDYEENASRGTLEQTYEQIFSDLKNAEENTVYTDVPEIKWRVSKCAINALYARIYLARGEFQNALDYANKALTNAPSLYDYNTLTMQTNPSKYAATSFWPAMSIYYSETNGWSLKKILYDYTEWIYPELSYYPTQYCPPSTDLMNLYDKENDCRFTNFFIEHGSRRIAVDYDWYRHNQLYDGRYGIEGLTTAEMLLIKAECQVRLGQWQEGLNTLTTLRTARIKPTGTVALTAENQAEALKVVLQERRREVPFTSRTGDIKRFSVTADTSDDVTFTRDFYEMTTTSVDTKTRKTYTIKGSDKSWAYPIYATEITASQGVIEQNPE